MKNNEIIGKRIIDKNVREIGKVLEVTFDYNTFNLNNLYAISGNAISKKYYQISSDKILAIGDFLQISNTEEEIKNQTVEKLPEDDQMTVDSIVGKKVIDINANEIGKISSIEIDIDSQKISYLTVSKLSTLGKNSHTKLIKDDIKALGDYILLNKELTFETNEEKTTEKD